MKRPHIFQIDMIYAGVLFFVIAVIFRGTCYFRSRGFFWFRTYGYGLVIKNTRVHPMSFSQRVNASQFIKIGRFVITTLRPD